MLLPPLTVGHLKESKNQLKPKILELHLVLRSQNCRLGAPP